MTTRTNTKKNRQVYEETNEVGMNGKPVLAPTNEVRPPQEREWREFRTSAGEKCGAWMSAGQTINPDKWIKKEGRYWDNDKKLWL